MKQPFVTLKTAVDLFPTLTRTLAKISAAKADGKATVTEWVDIFVSALVAVGQVLMPMVPAPAQRVVSRLLLVLPIVAQAVVEWDEADEPTSPGGTKRTADEYAEILQRAAARIFEVLVPGAPPAGV